MKINGKTRDILYKAAEIFVSGEDLSDWQVSILQRDLETKRTFSRIVATLNPKMASDYGLSA